MAVYQDTPISKWRRLTAMLVAAIGIAFIVASGGGGGSSGGGDTTVVSIEVTPGGFILVELGDSQMLTAQAYNAAGDPVDTDITWSSNDEATVSVDADGLAVANDSIGSAQLMATADGIQSPTVLAAVVLPAINSILVSDDQFTSEPVPVDPNAEFIVGSRYQVSVTEDVNPEIGDILIASGETPVAGQVVDVEDNGDGTLLVTLELIPIDRVFTGLEIDEEFDLSNIPIEVPEEIAEYYDVSVDEDGTYVFEPIPGKEIRVDPVISAPGQLTAPTAIVSSIPQLPAVTPPSAFLTWGPFECKLIGSIIPLKFSSGLPRFILRPNTMIGKWRHSNITGLLEEVGVEGSIFGSVHMDFSLQIAPQAKFECQNEIGWLPLPANGALAAFFSLYFTIDGGFAVGAKVDVAEVDITLEGEISGTDIDIGIVKPLGIGDYVYLTEGDAEISRANTGITLPPGGNLTRDFTPFVQLFLKPGVAIGPTLALGRVKFDMVAFKVGPKISFDLDTVTEQIRRQIQSNEEYAQFNATVDGEIGPATDTVRLLNILGGVGVRTIEPKLELFSKEFDRSPESGSFVIDNSTPALGDNVEFTLNIAAGTESFLGLYGIDRIHLYHVADTSDPVPVLIESTPLVSNTTQTQFTIPWTVNIEGGTVFATVEDVILRPVRFFNLNEVVLASVPLAEQCIDFGGFTNGTYTGTSSEGSVNGTFTLELVQLGSALGGTVIESTLGTHNVNGAAGCRTFNIQEEGGIGWGQTGTAVTDDCWSGTWDSTVGASGTWQTNACPQ